MVGSLPKRSWVSLERGAALPQEMAAAITELNLQNFSPHDARAAVTTLEQLGGLRVHETINTAGYVRDILLRTADDQNLDTIPRFATFQGLRLYRAPSGVLYMAYYLAASSYCCACGMPSCRSCGQQGTLEPLAKVAGQLASMQTQAAWATLLVLQIAEARQLPDEIVPLILSSLPVPGAYPSMGS